jgi:anti-anti-sigma factor
MDGGSVVGGCDYFGVQCVEENVGAVTVILWGELDVFSARVLTRHLDAICITQPSALVIDATRLSFCAAAGLRTIARVHELCVDQGTTLQVVGLQRLVQRVFDVTGLSARLSNET